MSEDLQQLVDPIAALGDVEFGDVDTSMPLLPSGMHKCRIEKIEVVDSKKVEGNKNMVVYFETLEDVIAHDSDRELKAGWKLRNYYPLQGSRDNPDWDYRENIARLIDAVDGPPAPGEKRMGFDADRMLNAEVVLRIVVSEDKESGILRNEIKSVVHPVD